MLLSPGGHQPVAINRRETDMHHTVLILLLALLYAVGSELDYRDAELLNAHASEWAMHEACLPASADCPLALGLLAFTPEAGGRPRTPCRERGDEPRSAQCGRAPVSSQVSPLSSSTPLCRTM